MRTPLFATALAALILSGCATVGPDFHKPDFTAPAKFRHAPVTLSDQEQFASVASIEAWWQIFRDDQLNRLESAALKHSPQLDAALAHVNDARAQLGVARAARSLSLNAAGQLQAAGESTAQSVPYSGQTYRTRGDDYRVPFSASYELDLWGRVRRSVETARASLAATEADQRGVLLTLTADVALYHFALRALDAELEIVSATTRSRRETVEISAVRYRTGLSPELDVHRARIEAATAEADLADLRRRREQTANALAVATGTGPSDFTISEGSGELSLPPPIPPGLPAQLLDRRPDLAAAAATLHARTAAVGVAEAARLPTITLTGSAGFSSADLGQLLNRPAQFWNVGAGLTAPLLDGGRLRARVEQARAQTDEALASFRQQALIAFREVDDALVALREQTTQERAQAEAREAATVAAQIARIRYHRGLANYLDVTDAERSLFQLQRAQSQLTGARYASTVNLIKALGGSWGQL